MNELKAKAANAAIEYIPDNSIVGVGTGTTVYYFIQALAKIKQRIEACVVSSVATAKLVRAAGIEVIELNVANEIPIYIDGADQVNQYHQMIKGGGGALTREKIIATAAKQFICIVDETKFVPCLGTVPVPVEVIPMARSFVGRELVKLGGDPEYREGFITDNGNIILDVHNLPITTIVQLEDTLNGIPGVVENGLFTKRLADVVLIGEAQGVRSMK